MGPRAVVTKFRQVVAVVMVAAAGTPVLANPASDALRERAARELYNLDREAAAATYRAAIAADQQDGAAYRGLASVLWMDIGFLRGTMTVDSYLGRVSRDNVPLPPPPAPIASAFREAVDRAVALARARVKVSPRSAAAHYELGAAIGLRASYVATVDGSMMGAFRAARGAFDAHEKALELDRARADAGLIVGTYRYIVAALSPPARWIAYVAGFGGGRERGIELVTRAANYPGDNQADARIALVLLFNRERRYDEALTHLAWLRDRFPGNRLAWLETGSTLLRAGRAAEAERFLIEGMARLASDTRPRMFGEDALWHYRLGLSRAELNRPGDARADLRRALTFEARKWVHARTHLELGKIEIESGNRAAAVPHLRSAIEFAKADSDPGTAREATTLLAADGNTTATR